MKNQEEIKMNEEYLAETNSWRLEKVTDHEGVYYNVYCKKSNEVIDSFINLEYDNEGNYKIFKELKDV